MKPFDRVLLIDDNAATNFLHRELLEEHGMARKIVTCRNGREALAYLTTPTEGFPNLILVDVRMPVLDGFEFLEQVRTMPVPLGNSVVVVMLSSSSNPKDKEKARQLDVPYLIKPLQEHDLLALADCYLSRNNGTKEAILEGVSHD